MLSQRGLAGSAFSANLLLQPRPLSSSLRNRPRGLDPSPIPASRTARTNLIRRIRATTPGPVADSRERINGAAAGLPSSVASAASPTSATSASPSVSAFPPPATNGTATVNSAARKLNGSASATSSSDAEAVRAARERRTEAIKKTYSRVNELRREYVPPDVFDYLLSVRDFLGQDDKTSEQENSWPLPFLPPPPPFLQPFLPGSAAPGAAADKDRSASGLVGPPRFFCPIEAVPPEGQPVDELPRLFFLPGIEGTGNGLKLHHKALARLFELTCLHVPLSDRTSFPDLVSIVEAELVSEHRLRPHRPLFLLGESFGAVLALAAAWRLKEMPITLVLVNPATSFPRSPLQPLIPLLQSVPNDLYRVVPYLLSFTMGNPLRMASGRVPLDSSQFDRLVKMRENLLDLLPLLPLVADILPQATLEWKLHLLAEGCEEVEAMLADIQCDTLIVAGGEDNMLPSADEAKRLHKLMGKAKTVVRQFPNSGHTLLLESDIDMGSVIKGSSLYRRSGSGSSSSSNKRARGDPIIDNFVMPTPEEFARSTGGMLGSIRHLSSPVFLSTVVADEEDTRRLERVMAGRAAAQANRSNKSMQDGQSATSPSSSPPPSSRIVLGLSGLPVSERPLLFIGNHQTYAPDLSPLVAELLANGVALRGLTHPLALGMLPTSIEHNPMAEEFRVFGAVPVSPANTYKLLANQEAALLFPGGVREALRKRAEEYKLFWPRRAEFVRMAVKFGAVIIPYSAVGVDDGYNYVLDADDLPHVPYYGKQMVDFMEAVPRVRDDDEAAGPAEERFLPPVVLPKQINRLYFKFGAPIRTEGMQEVLTDKAAAAALYAHVKGEVEDGLAYLLKKREEDPYKDLGARLLYEASWGGNKQAPTFNP